MKRLHRRWARVLWAVVTAGAVATFAASVVLNRPDATAAEAR